MGHGQRSGKIFIGDHWGRSWGGEHMYIYINIVEFIFPAIDGQFIMNKNTVHVVGKFYL